MRWKLFVLLVVLAVLLAACNSSTPPPEAQEESPGIVTLDAQCNGAAGPLITPLYPNAETPATLSDGSLYEIYKPDNWNGRLMLFAHGYFDPYANGGGEYDYAHPILPNHYEDPNTAAVYNEVVCNLVLNGFALAWSSYNVNGYAIKSGYKSTQELRNLAVDLLIPSRVYVMGFSLGGQVAITLAEKYPSSYAGALPACGPVAGSTKQLAYVGDVRAVFDYAFPGVLADADAGANALDVPEPPPAWGTSTSPSPVMQAIAAALNQDQDLESARKFAGVTQLKLPYTNDTELINSWTEALYFAVRGVNNAMWLAGGNPYDNQRTSYSGLSRKDNRQLNRGVIRYTADPDAQAYFRDNYDTSGNLNTPVLTLHTNLDPQIPFSHEADYGAKVSARRKSSNLAQQYVSRYGHCNFKPEEVVSALNGLITWAEAPSWLKWLFKPKSGDVTMN